MSKKILLIEDDAFLVRFYKARLEQRGFLVSFVENGDLAEQAMLKYQPDVIVLDIMLPGKNGFDILESLRKNPKTRNIPVIILTQLAQESDKNKLIELGANLYMVKMEHKLDDLIDEIEKITSHNKV